MNKAERILEILNDRIDDAEKHLRETEIGHPMEDKYSYYLLSLKDLKKDLMREGIIERLS